MGDPDFRPLRRYYVIEMIYIEIINGDDGSTQPKGDVMGSNDIRQGRKKTKYPTAGAQPPAKPFLKARAASLHPGLFSGISNSVCHIVLAAIALVSLGLGSCSVLESDPVAELDMEANLQGEQKDEQEDNQVFEPFRDGVNTAMTAAEMTQVAETEADWRQVAQHWHTAIEMMKAVSYDHPKYAIAQQRATETYPENFSYAQQQAGEEAIAPPTREDDRLTQVDFGEEGWPFLIDGELACEQAESGKYTVKLLTLHGADHVFAVNGPAQARALERNWQDIHTVWRDSPAGDGKVPINWVIMRGEALCQENTTSDENPPQT